MNYFYDKQIRRYLQQVIRVFSHFNTQIGVDDLGKPTYQKIPVRYGDLSRQVSHIIKENSENKISSVPMMAVYINALRLNPDRRIKPSERNFVQVNEKLYNKDSRQYENKSGSSYSVERHMPVPYDMTINVDLWTSNTEQKLQILEQILVLFNPVLNLNSGDNPLDWSRLSYLTIQDIIWSSAQVPQGVENVIDISTLTFDMQIFLNPPARVSRQKIIHTIIQDLQVLDKDKLSEWQANNLNLADQHQEYIIVAQKGFNVKFNCDNTLSLIDSQNRSSVNGEVYRWDTLIKNFGQINENISVLNLVTSTNNYVDGQEILGTIKYNQSNANLLDVTLNADSLPATTLSAVDRFVDPRVNYPGDGTLPASAQNQRYILTNDLPIITGWGLLSGAEKNDIIEYLGTGSGSGTVTVGANYSVNAQENAPRGITFNNNGTKMFIVGTSGDDVNEYSLSVGFDLSSTVTFVDSFSVSSQENAPTAVKFNADGTKMFITGVQHNNVHEYALTTGFDVSTASFTQTLVTTVDSDNFGLDFKPDGTKMYITGAGNDKIYEFDLTTGFDISTATFVQDKSIIAQDWEPFGIEWSPDGTRLFIVGTGGNEINLYKLSTAWDISTATFVEFYHVGGNPSGIHISPDGTKMFIVGSQTDLVRSYTLSVPYAFTESLPGWVISFDSSAYNSKQIVLNLENNYLYSFDNNEWETAICKIYEEGLWRIYL